MKHTHPDEFAYTSRMVHLSHRVLASGELVPGTLVKVAGGVVDVAVEYHVVMPGTGTLAQHNMVLAISGT